MITRATPRHEEIIAFCGYPGCQELSENDVGRWRARAPFLARFRGRKPCFCGPAAANTVNRTGGPPAPRSESRVAENIMAAIPLYRHSSGVPTT